MKVTGRNVAASVRQRLLSLAQARKWEFNRVLTRYGVERLLFRLAASKHAARFLLKGATLFTVWEGMPHRATKDLDLLGQADPLGRQLQDARLPAQSTVSAPKQTSISTVTSPNESRRQLNNSPSTQVRRPPAKAWVKKGGFASSQSLADLIDHGAPAARKKKR